MSRVKAVFRTWTAHDPRAEERRMMNVCLAPPGRFSRLLVPFFFAALFLPPSGCFATFFTALDHLLDRLLRSGLFTAFFAAGFFAAVSSWRGPCRRCGRPVSRRGGSRVHGKHPALRIETRTIQSPPGTSIDR
jgi:hypothetical protein